MTFVDSLISRRNGAKTVRLKDFEFELFGTKWKVVFIDKVKETAALQANQALTNYTITKSSHNIFGIVYVKTITVSADIIQFK